MLRIKKTHRALPASTVDVYVGLFIRGAGLARLVCVSTDETIGRNNTSLILRRRGVLEPCCVIPGIRYRLASKTQTIISLLTNIMTNSKVSTAINTSAFICSSALVGISIATIYLASDAYDVFTNSFPPGSYGWSPSHW